MLNVTCWGTRGSIPVSGPSYERHGGATTCLEIELHDPDHKTPKRVIIDCGTGLASLSRTRGHLLQDAIFLQTHCHQDHIQGFPFFGPLFNPAARFEFFSVRRDGCTLKEILAAQMARPLFPVALDALPAELHFESLPPSGSRLFGELCICWSELCHPSGSTGFRLEYREKTVVFSGDVEVQQDSRDELIELSAGADLLIMDAQYFDDEYKDRRGFGHSTAMDAVEVALNAGVRHLLLTHHDPGHDDRRLDEKLAIAREYAAHLGGRRLMIDNAFDSMTQTLGTIDTLVPVAELQARASFLKDIAP